VRKVVLGFFVVLWQVVDWRVLLCWVLVVRRQGEESVDGRVVVLYGLL
jgi:hypothetical protein